MRTRGTRLYAAIPLLLGLAIGCSSDDSSAQTDGVEATDGVDLTESNDATDATNGADQTDGEADSVDGTAATDQTDAVDTVDGADTSETINRLGATRLGDLAGGSVYPGALATSGSLAAWCDGATLKIQAAEESEPESIGLESACIAVVLDDSTPVVATAAGLWVRDPGGDEVTAAGPAPMRLRLQDGMLYGAMGTADIARAPADLSTAPELISTDFEDIRDVLAVDGDYIFALGTGGVVRANSDGITLGSYPTNPAMANDLAVSVEGDILVAVAGQGLSILAPDTLAIKSELPLRGIVMDIAVGTDALAGYVMVSAWSRAQLVDIRNSEEPAAGPRKEFLFPGDSARSVAIGATSDGFISAGLNHVTRLTTELGEPQPQLHIDQRRRRIDISPELGSGAVGILIHNDGNVPLALSNFRSTSDRMTVQAFPESIDAGGIGFVQVDIAGAEDLEATFSFDTDDPENPTVDYFVVVNPALLQVGDAAPDFVLPTTNGGYTTLSALTGTVVHLKFFNAL